MANGARKGSTRATGDDSGFADQLRAIIRCRGLTAYALAHSAGVACSVVSRFLNQESHITLATFAALSSALGLKLVETARGRKGGAGAIRLAADPTKPNIATTAAVETPDPVADVDADGSSFDGVPNDDAA